MSKATLRVLVAVALLAGACARQAPVTEDVSIEFLDDGEVIVTAETAFDLTPESEEAAARVAAARSAALHATDPWAVRFARLSPGMERTTFEKERGELERVVHAVKIPSRDLQTVFSDANITVHVLQGEDWSELALYPGNSGRATREQQERFRADLESWSSAVARYYSVVQPLYAYMNLHPHRARDLFAALMDVKGPDGIPALVTEDEQPLVDDVVAAMEQIATRMDAHEGRLLSIGEDADAIYNPFPGQLTVIVPGEIVSSEGFEVRNGRAVIPPVDLLAAVEALEGRWMTPDPLVALLREETPAPETIASLQRRAPNSVNAVEVSTALREKLARPSTYVVRWRNS